jgi:hypothetical protein
MKSKSPSHPVAPESGAGPHPSLEALVELALDTLSEDDAFAVREHLLGCAECLERARSLVAVPEPPAAAAEPPGEKAAAWREVSTALALPVGPTSTPAPVPPFTFPARRPAAAMLALAAALLCGVAIGFFAAGRGASSPQREIAAATSTHLLPTDFAVLGTPLEPVNARCPPPGGLFFWTLGSLEGSPTTRFAVELTGPAGVRRIERVVNDFGAVEIALPRKAVPTGSYRLRVENLDSPGAAAKEFLVTVDCP